MDVSTQSNMQIIVATIEDDPDVQEKYQRLYERAFNNLAPVLISSGVDLSQDTENDPVYILPGTEGHDHPAAIQDTVMYTGPQAMAMVRMEMLRLTSGAELDNMVIRGMLLRELGSQTAGESGSQPLWMFHPSATGFNSPEALIAEEGKLTVSEQSDANTWNNIIFPYAREVLHMSERAFWGKFKSKSNARDLTPYLRRAITGKSSSKAVNEFVEALVEVHGNTDEGLRHVVDELTEMGAEMTTRKLRNTLNPDGVTPPEVVILELGENGVGESVAIMRLNTDQKEFIFYTGVGAKLFNTPYRTRLKNPEDMFGFEEFAMLRLGDRDRAKEAANLVEWLNEDELKRFKQILHTKKLL